MSGPTLTVNEINEALDIWAARRGKTLDGWAESSRYYAVIAEHEDGTTSVVNLADLAMILKEETA